LLRPSIAAEPLTSALLNVIGTGPSDPTAAAYRREAYMAMLTSRDADTMPLRPVSTPAAGTGEELQLVKIARKKAACSDDRDAHPDVNGREVAAEWIYRYARDCR
jgi:hypothetical protein